MMSTSTGSAPARFGQMDRPGTFSHTSFSVSERRLSRLDPRIRINCKERKEEKVAEVARLQEILPSLMHEGIRGAQFVMCWILKRASNSLIPVVHLSILAPPGEYKN
jgi:hypothetical protein